MSDFTKIPESKKGPPRFGYDHTKEPVNGEVIEYRLSPEEIEKRYGPPVEKKKKNFQRDLLSKDVLIEKLKTLSVPQIAMKYNVRQEILYRMIERHGIKLNDKNRLLEEGVKEEEGREANMTETKEKKSRMEIAEEKMSMQDYIDYKTRDGLTDKEIMDRTGIHNDVFYMLKRKWGLIRMDAKDLEKLASPTPSMPVNEEEKEPANLDEDLFTWATPVRYAHRDSIIKIHPKNVSLSKKALQEINANIIAVGVSRDGRLALAPARNMGEGYKVNSKSGRRICFGGRVLVEFLQSHGFEVGRAYKLRQAENGWLITAKEEGFKDGDRGDSE